MKQLALKATTSPSNKRGVQIHLISTKEMVGISEEIENKLYLYNRDQQSPPIIQWASKLRPFVRRTIFHFFKN